MAKSIKNKQCENITTKKVFDTLKSKKFLEELWSDMVSDMKQKPSYIRIKEMVEQLITEKSDYLALPSSDSELLKKKTNLAEISILGHTIDTVISKVLYNKLQNEFPSSIVDMINEFNKESPTENEDHSQGNNASTEKLSVAVKESAKAIFNDSDSESDVSDCKFSICSVSSVHTSDLSSYDDAVSISSEDEESGKTKKKLSVKEASERIFQNKLEEIHDIGKPAKRQKKDKKQEKPKLEDASCSTIDLSPRKSLPARVRKPNSKYSSEDMICPMKQFPNLEQSPPSASSSPPKSLPKEITESTPIRKRGRPMKHFPNVEQAPVSAASSLPIFLPTEMKEPTPIRKRGRPMKHSPNSEQPLVSASSSLPIISPKEVEDFSPIRKRGRPRKNEIKTLSFSTTSLQRTAASEDLSAIENSKSAMKLHSSCDQRNSSFQPNKSQTTSSGRKTAVTMFAT